MGIYYIITNLNWHFFHYSSTRGSSNQPSSQWYQSTFSTALQVMEWGVIPRPPIAVAKAKISRHWPASSGINPPWVAVDLFHPSSGVSYFPRSQAKDTEINKKEPAQKEKCDKNQPGLLTNADGYVKVYFSEFHTAVIHQSLEKLHCLWQCASIWSHPRNMYNGLKSVVLDGRIPVKIIICCCHREVRSITFNYNQPIQQKLFDHTTSDIAMDWYVFVHPSISPRFGEGFFRLAFAWSLCWPSSPKRARINSRRWDSSGEMPRREGEAFQYR